MNQTGLMRAFVDAEHFRYRRFATGRPRRDEVALDGGWRLVVEAPATPLVRQMRLDFRVFCERCMGVTVGGRNTRTLRWRLAEGVKVGGAFVRRPAITPSNREGRRTEAPPTFETFSISVAEDEVVIEAGHERGLLHGTHYLERLMADRGAPCLRRGRIERTPRFSPRISNGIFIHSDQKMSDLDNFSDEYLSLMSHFGVNGIHVHTHLWEFCRNRHLLELNAPGFDRNVATLRRVARRLHRFGIDLYLYLATRLFAADHRVFRRHPSARGSRIEFLVEGSIQHNLCSGNERVLACYEETLENLFRAAPEVAGAIAIVGGEGFFHCYTRPQPPFEGYTNCPRCRHREPAKAVATLMNRAAAAVKRAGAEKRFFAWPYSAFTWSGKDRAQLKWIEHLSKDVSLLSNFDCGSEDPTTGAGVTLYDYNIKSIGPSRVFAAQARKARAVGRPIFCKTETNTTPESFFVPYLPVHHRWHRRFQAMAKAGVAGFVGQWRFYGMNGSPPEELQYHATWNPERSTDSLLADMARRDFGVSAAQARRVVTGWRTLSEAWDDFPYSALMTGEREFYMRGPFHLGPAHPLIFNPQDHYGLGPKFRLLREDLFELGTPDNLDELIRNAKPRYVSDLLLTVPFGVERCLALLGRCRRKWENGLELIRSAVAADVSLRSGNPRTHVRGYRNRAQMELDVCETVLVHLTTTENVVRFYAGRDALWRRRSDASSFRKQAAALQQIIRAEIANARRILPILVRDPRIGYGHCYGMVYDAAMVNDKLRQCAFVLENELPRLSQGIRFHLWNEYP